jgi:hypothetical protein
LGIGDWAWRKAENKCVKALEELEKKKKSKRKKTGK